MKNEILFKIERTFAVGNIGVVLGRPMGPGDLRFGPGSRLGGVAAKPWGSRDFGLYDPNGAGLVFYEDR